MFWVFLIGHLLSMHVQTVRLAHQEFDTHRCVISLDPVYGGNLTDCSDLDFSNLPRLRGLPYNTTTLILDRTNIRCLHKHFFKQETLSALRHLSIRESNLETIEVDALFGLHGLEILNLENNRLPFCGNRSFPAGMFHHVPNLRHLFIGYNIRYTDTTDCHTYQDNLDIFSSLPYLMSLSIDAVSGTLHLCDQFSDLTHLRNLTIVCNKVSYISNSSLKALRHLQLKVLNLVALRRGDTPLESGVFQNLSHLDYLSLDGIHVSNHGILLALEPFANRSMTEIKLKRTNIFQTFNVPSTIFNDGIIDEDARFLSSICLRHFSWVNSLLFAVKPNTLTRTVWSTCLVSLDLSRNKLENTGWLSVVLELTRLKNLKEVTVSTITSPPSEDIPKLVHFHLSDIVSGHDGGRVTDMEETVDNNEQNISSIKHKSMLLSKHDRRKFTRHAEMLSQQMRHGETWSQKMHHGETRNQEMHHGEQRNQEMHHGEKRSQEVHHGEKRNQEMHHGEKRSQEVHHGGTQSLDTVASREDNTDDLPESQPDRRTGPSHGGKHSRFPYNGNITYYFPASAERVKAINMIFAGITLEYWTVVCAGTSKLREIYWVNNESVRVRGVIYGLETLKVLGLSGSMFDIASHFFDTFHGLEVLLLDNITPDSFFHTQSLQRLLRNLTNLRYLDVSSNKLNSLLFPPDTFSSTPNISHAILSQNRFSNIPFDLDTTMNLQVLDLSNNAILFLSDQEMLALTSHVTRVSSFILRLQGNGIACVCSQASFFVWVFTTPVSLDQRSSYECVTEDLQKVNITDLDDIPAFSRACHGRYFLMAAIILASVMIIVFLIAYVVARFRTSIEAFLLGMFVRAFRPMRPEDYRIQVFVGYADDDYDFVRHTLLEYLEDELKLTTFVHQRDLVGGYTDQQFYDAISNSWRVLIVLSEKFLTSYSMSHIVMKYASHSVTAVNQHRVFVLLEETQVRAIPDYLRGLLEDTWIILIPNLRQKFSYQQKQTIKECLRPSQ